MAFRDLIFTNFRRKLFALVLAVLIWATIHFADQKNRWWTRSHASPQTNSMTFPQ
jgi:hypothetical protein